MNGIFFSMILIWEDDAVRRMKIKRKFYMDIKRKFRGLWKIIFGRTTILIFLLVVQLAALFAGFAILDNKVIIMNYALGFLSVVVLIYVVNARQNTSFKLMWIIFILAVPVMGVTFYIFTKLQPGSRYISRRINELLIEENKYLIPKSETVLKIRSESRRELGLFRYIYEKGNYPVYDNASVRYFPLGDDKYREMVRQLRDAKEFIFLEYFIIDRGEMWDTILDILVQKAREGVEVRLMYDGTCTLSLLPKNYPEQMKKLGIKCRVFSPMMPFLSTHQNNRDHRKILVIDGRVAFTGGVNLADEYINRRERFGHWKDTAIMVKGEAVNSFTIMFLQMWNISEHTRTDYDKYMRFGHEPDPSMRNGGYIVPYGDSPFDNEEVGKKVYLDIINNSKEYVDIMTPYLILDEEMTNALVYAAQRGVVVRLILPHIPDKKYAYLLARTHYAELISQGVKIYEYTPGFVHAKVFSSDNEKVVVGTINLDFRSLYLHFECAAYIWKNPVIDDINEDFRRTLEKCRQMTLDDCRHYSLVGRILGKILRFIAPLM